MGPGAELVVEERPEGLLIRQNSLFPEKMIEEVAGKLKWDGPPVSIEDMNAGVLKIARLKHACD